MLRPYNQHKDSVPDHNKYCDSESTDSSFITFIYVLFKEIETNGHLWQLSY